MKVGLVLNKIPGLSETFLVSKIKLLEELGYEVVIFTTREDPSSSYVVKQQKVISRNRILQFFYIIFQILILFLIRPIVLLKFLGLEKKDLISLSERIKNLYLNCHILSENLDWLHFEYATLMIKRENVAKAINAKMGVSFRGYDICIYPLKHPNCYEKSLKKIDKIHSISKDLIKRSKEIGFGSETPFYVINPGIDTKIFDIDSKKLPFQENKIKFLTVARLHWKKGHEYTLQALADLKKKGYEFHYNIIGDGPEAERINYTIENLKLNGHVSLHGPLERDEIIRFYKNSSIYLQYSIQEGFCNSVLESQAMGLLSIVSDAEGLAENIIDGKTGWVVPKMKPESLSKKIELVCNLDEKEKIIIRENASKRIKNNFDITVQKSLFKDFFD